MKNLKESKGITLIALVITIIILLILAGITISSLTGENGLLEKVKQAVEKHKKAEEEEQAQLDEFYKQLGLEGEPPANTEDTEAGTVVALEEGWGLETVNYYKTLDGTEVKNLTKLSTVYAVSVGNGETIPVPKRFYYVGGNLDNGVIISDSEEDKYDGKIDKTTHEYAPNLKGNQFVWIPCTRDEYHKTNTFLKSTEYDTVINDAELTQIEKYGGFYVGRYETGTSDIQGIDFAGITTTGWMSDKTDYKKVTSGKVTSKANEIPYYHSTYWTAYEMSRRMYKNDTERNKYVNSGLITGTMWDVMINVMNEKTGCDLLESNWGNYINTSISECRGLHCNVTNSAGGHETWISSNEYTKSNNTRAILSTGANDFTQKMHIYDVAGNLWEWTLEMATNDSVKSYIIRGGSFHNDYSKYPVSFRNGVGSDETSTNNGFRVALYIK